VDLRLYAAAGYVARSSGEDIIELTKTSRTAFPTRHRLTRLDR
jgi:hypothetical protein